MAIWQPGDLVLLLSGPTGTYNSQSIAAWATDGTYRGLVSLNPPLDDNPPESGIPPVQPVIYGNLLYGYEIANTEPDFYAVMDGTANNLTNNRVPAFFVARGQCFDAAGNRYIDDYDLTNFTHIRQIAPDTTETALPYDTSDPNAFGSGPNRLQVDRTAAYLYWNDCADAPYNESINIGCNKFELATGTFAPKIDITAIATPIVPSGSLFLADFVVSPTTDEIYFCVGGSSANEYIIVTDLDGNYVRDFVVSASFEVGGIATNSAGTILAVLHDDEGGPRIVEFFNTATGASLLSIDFVADSGLGGIWGLCFAALALYPGLAHAPRIGMTQDLFTRTTP